MNLINAVVGNLSMSDIIFDPFKTFNLSYNFKIENLEKIYFNLYKTYPEKHLLNEAFIILKDPIKKAGFLCNYFGFIEFDKGIPKKLLQEHFDVKILFNEIVFLAENNEWEKCWEKIQIYNYIVKHDFSNI